MRIALLDIAQDSGDVAHVRALDSKGLTRGRHGSGCELLILVRFARAIGSARGLSSLVRFGVAFGFGQIQLDLF